MKLILLSAALLLSTSTFAQDYGDYGISCADKSEDAKDSGPQFIEEFKNKAVGSGASTGWTVYKRSCLLHDPVTKKCVKKSEKQAKGSLVVDSLETASGSFYCWFQIDPRTKEKGRNYSADTYFRFHYNGSTRAEKKVSGVVVDHPWGHLKPHGRLEVWLCAGANSKFSLNYKFRASAGHPDDANDFMRDYVAKKMKPIFADYIKQVLGYPNISVIMDDSQACMLNAG